MHALVLAVKRTSKDRNYIHDNFDQSMGRMSTFRPVSITYVCTGTK